MNTRTCMVSKLYILPRQRSKCMSLHSYMFIHFDFCNFYHKLWSDALEVLEEEGLGRGGHSAPEWRRGHWTSWHPPAVEDPLRTPGKYGSEGRKCIHTLNITNTSALAMYYVRNI